MEKKENGQNMWEQFKAESEQVLDSRFWQEFKHIMPHKIPPVDICEDEKYGYVYIDLPGLRKQEDLNISFNGQNMTIEGSLPAIPATCNEIVSERHTGPFKRSIALPFTFDGQVRAQYENGILLLVIPKVNREFKVPFGYGNL